MSGKCNALLLADRVIREDNGKRGFIGSFNTFGLPQFPFTVPPFFIYANIEDFTGDVEFSLSIMNEKSNLVVFSSGGELKSLVPERESDIVIPVVGLTFPKEGTYGLTLSIGGYNYGSRRLHVNHVQIGPKQGGQR